MIRYFRHKINRQNFGGIDFSHTIDELLSCYPQIFTQNLDKFFAIINDFATKGKNPIWVIYRQLSSTQLTLTNCSQSHLMNSPESAVTVYLRFCQISPPSLFCFSSARRTCGNYVDRKVESTWRQKSYEDKSLISIETHRVALYKIAEAWTGFITFGFDLLYCTKRTAKGKMREDYFTWRSRLYLKVNNKGRWLTAKYQDKWI